VPTIGSGGQDGDVTDYLAVNRLNWDERAPIHAASTEYAFDRFVADPAFLSGVVRFDLPRLGDIAGLRGVHLQCHIGTDTVSLARLDARMTGLDFSEASLEQARRLAGDTGADVDFHAADVYRAVEVLGAGRFDLVYTGVGALCWLPDVARWAKVVAELLRPGGRLFIREGHPMLWALDDTADPATLRYTYFERAAPLVFDEPTTYAGPGAVLANSVTHSWNHGLGEIVTAVMGAGLRLTQLVEHDSVPWLALPGQMAVDDLGEWRLSTHPERLAASYTLQAVKS
jgi:SAM-dependent methyltransferase